MGQQLTALLMGLNALPEHDEPGLRPPSHTERVHSLQTIASSLMQHMHDLAWRLRPAVLDTFGLEPALRQHIEEWSERHEIPVDFISRGLSNDSRLAPAVETAFYRVTQEALTNVVRHAEATQVSVLLECRDGHVAVIIEDNGRGFEADAEESASRLGLLGMQERMELVRGTLTVESSPGSGTTVYARAPLEQQDAC
jgi:signal transduction histidine kinase